MSVVKIEKTLIDHETGKVEKSETTTFKKETKEDDFVKMYLQELALLTGLQAKEKDVLNELLKRMGYNNQVVLSTGVKEQICRSLGIMKKPRTDRFTGEMEFINVDSDGNVLPSTNALNVMISRICKLEVIKKVGKGIYEVNPRLFGKGTWDGIRKIRKTITWSKEGRQEETAFHKIVNKRLGNEKDIHTEE